MPRCSLRARGGSSPCSPCSPPSGGCAWLRVAPVPAPSGAALALRCAPRRPERVGTRGVPTLNPWPPARVEQGAGQGSQQAREQGTPGRLRQSAWTEDAAWPATGLQGPTRCRTRTTAKPRPEAMVARTRLPTAVLWRQDRLRRASIRPCNSSKLPLTSAPLFACPSMLAAAPIREGQELSGASPPGHSP